MDTMVVHEEKSTLSSVMYQKISGKLFQKKYLCLILCVFVFLIYSENVSLNVTMTNFSHLISADDVPARLSLNKSETFSFESSEVPTSDEVVVVDSVIETNSVVSDMPLVDWVFYNHGSANGNEDLSLTLGILEENLENVKNFSEEILDNLETTKLWENSELYNSQSATTHRPTIAALLKRTKGRAGVSATPIITNDIIRHGYKTIVFYTKFFGGSWSLYLRNGRTDLAYHGCPVSQCLFSYDPSAATTADAVIFHETGFHENDIPETRSPHQRYIWMNAEAPCPEERNKLDRRHGRPGFFNWTATYHRGSEVTMPYGGLAPRGENKLPSRLFPLDRNSSSFKDYLQDLEKATPVKEQLNGTHLPEGCNLDTFFQRPKLLTWMVSHCDTAAGREIYITKLRNYIPVDVYGACGDLICGKNHLDIYCYTDVLQPNYKFYLAFENSWCNDYITEKVWNPMLYGLVPVVYGGSKYEEFLPPNSYVDATKLSPQELALRLKSIAESEEEYSKYHLWRKYWRVLVPSPMCDICEKLHDDVTETSIANLWDWWTTVNNCTRKAPKRPDNISNAMFFFEKLGQGFEMFNSFFGRDTLESKVLREG